MSPLSPIPIMSTVLALFQALGADAGASIASLLLLALFLITLRSAPYRPARDTARGGERVLILGSGSLARNLIEAIEAGSPRWTIAGVAVDQLREGEPPAFPLTGSLDHLGDMVRSVHPDRILVALEDRRGRLPVDRLLESKLGGVLIEDGVEVHERLTGKLAIESLRPSALIYSRDFRWRPFERTVARTLSFLTALVGLVVTAPLSGLIAMLIRLDSAGPVFFMQERVGKKGRRFRLIKFRTMHPAGAAHSEWAADNEERITRVGRWLRRLHLDELPQFVNVLRGDMNLVGPRPHPVSNFDLFTANIPYYPLRSTVRPGLTGWAQIRFGYANNLEEETEKMRYDLYYLKHRSLWLDIRILIRTAWILVAGSAPESAAGRHAGASLSVGQVHRAA